MKILVLGLTADSLETVQSALSDQGYEVAVEESLTVPQIEQLKPEVMITEATPTDLACCASSHKSSA